MEKIHDDNKPKLGMEFAEELMAYDFYNAYAGNTGFSTRVEYINYDRNVKPIKIVTNSRFVCYKAGYKKPDKRDYKYRTTRPEVRVRCLAKLGVRLNRDSGKYTIYDFKEEHNHELAPLGTRHMLKSQRKVSDAQAEQIEMVADSGICLGSSFELLGRQVGGRDALSFLKIDQKNYLRTRRQKEMGNGEHGRVLKYLQDKALKDPSFFYAFQLDSDNHITNIFWADAQMRTDYKLFGDVVSFDTTYKINNAHRPCAAFVGFNHHRMFTVFGAALMYDETVDSFRWLFDTFLVAMSNKHSRSIFTDQDAAMAKANSVCMPNTFHGLCIWHLSQNALKHVPHGVVDDQGVHSILSHFYYDVETEEDFETLWDVMLDDYKLHDNNWVKQIYTCRQKWAFAHIRDQWTARICSTQLSESFNAKVKNYLKSDYDLPLFFHHFDRVLSDIRYKELEAEFSLSQTCPRVNGPVRMLMTASTTYTKTIFEEFQVEYFKSLECLPMGQSVVDDGGCVELIVEYEKEERKVLKDNEGKLSCSCKLFERQGLMCCHALKVLKDVLNTLQLPEEYFLRRWTRKARALSKTDFATTHIEPDCKIDRTSRLRSLFSMYNMILTRASDCQETYEEAVKIAHELSIQVEKIISNKLVENKGNEDVDNSNIEVNIGNGNTNLVDCAGVIGLKRKKDPYPKRKKRIKGALEKAMKRAKMRNRKKNDKDMNNDSSPQTPNIEQQMSHEVQEIGEHPQVLKDVNNRNNYSVTTEALISTDDAGFSFTKLLYGQGVIDLDVLGIQNFESQASNTLLSEYRHFK